MARHQATADRAGAYSAGERGRNRVRLYRDPARGLFLEFREDGRRQRIRAGDDWDPAKAMADELAARLATGEEWLGRHGPPTLAQLFDNYIRDVTPTKKPSKQLHDKRAARLFCEILGGASRADRLTPASARRFICERQRRGDLRRRQERRELRARGIEENLKFLLAVLHWAVREGNLERNPLEGYRAPSEKSPRRPVLSAGEFTKLLDAALRMNQLVGPLLILVNETGHRLAAILGLRWCDVDLSERLVTWRAASDKQGREHTTPLSDAAARALRALQTHAPGIGSAPVFPAPRAGDVPLSRHMANQWWRRAEQLAGLAHVEGRGWHSLRRKFATELLDQPLKVLAQLGGWTDTRTLLQCYQQPDLERQRQALAERRPLVQTR